MAYPLTVTPWGSYSSGVTVKLYRVDPDNTRVDVSSTNLTGSASVAGDVITSPTVYGLTADTKYRLEFKWVSGSNTLETYMVIFCKP